MTLDLAGFLLTAAGLGAAGLVAYGRLSQRVTSLEDARKTDATKLDRIEGKVDAINTTATTLVARLDERDRHLGKD